MYLTRINERIKLRFFDKIYFLPGEILETAFYH